MKNFVIIYVGVKRSFFILEIIKQIYIIIINVLQIIVAYILFFKVLVFVEDVILYIVDSIM